MTESFYLVAGFAFLLFLERKPSSGSLNFSSEATFLLKQAAEIFLSTFVILTLYFFGVHKPGFLPIAHEGLIPFSLILSYFYARFFKKEFIFCLITLAFSYSISQGPLFSYAERVGLAALMSLGLALLQFGMEALRYRILFSQVPKPLSGLPIWLFSFSILLMACTGFLQLIIS